MPKEDTQFKPGRSGNPSGKPKTPIDIRKASAHTRSEIERVLNRFLSMDRATLQQRLQDPKATMLELAVGTIVAKAAKDGDQIRLNFILDRIIGKVKEQVAVEHSVISEVLDAVPTVNLLRVVSE